jgi:hypothetical protein
MLGWLGSAASGPLTWTLPNATSTAWINPYQRSTPKKMKAKEKTTAQTANLIKEKRNENQSDQPIR